MAEPPSNSRGARGSYANLICLKCRGRKIKCALPEDVEIQPSDIPQPPDRACARCKSLNLECVVQRTILGRPAAKRRRDGNASISAPELSPKEADEEVKDYLVAGVRDSATPSSRGDNQRPPPIAGEIFKTMVSPSHLTSVLLANDRRFGISIPAPTPQAPPSLSRLISSGMAAMLDENLPWHRFYLPCIPTLVSLRPQLSSETRAFENKATKLLFALLALLAIDAPVNRLKEDQQLRGHLKAAVAHYGQVFLFDPPTHHHTVAALTLLSEYHPAALINTQSAACTSVKAHLYIALNYRIAERLGMDLAVTKLQDFLDGKPPAENFNIDACVTHALQWCRILIDDAWVDGFTGHTSAQQWAVHDKAFLIIQTVDAVMQFRPPTVAIYYHFWYLKGMCIHMRSIAMMKTARKDPVKLFDIMQEIEQITTQEKNNILAQRPIAMTEDEVEAASAARILLDLHMDKINYAIVGAATFAAIMHGVASKAEWFSPKEALQISDLAVEKLKDLQLGKNHDTAPFLMRYLVARPHSFERLMYDFIAIAGNLKLVDVPHLPPVRQYAMQLLFDCKVMVEENAIRLKGLNMLHPSIDSQLKFFTDCADKLDAMATTPCRSAETAFADGCLNAASAKFVRCLRAILLEWKTTLAENTAQAHYMPKLDEQVEPLATFDVYDDSAFDVLFNQWSSWPQAGMLDLSSMGQQDGS